jgi:AraC family transcriptional regulator
MTLQTARFKSDALAAPGLYETLVGLMIEAGDLLKADPRAASRCLATATGILREAKPAPEPSASLGLAPWQVRRVEAVITARIGEPIRNSELAAEVRLSVGHFSRAFGRSFGDSPHNYVLARRVAYAKVLMCSTDDPLAQVAVSCGFCDQAHFSKVFRQFEHATPNVLRAQLRSVAEAQARQAA